MKRFGLLLALVLLFVLTTAIENSAQIKWNGGAGTTAWSDALNWVGGSVPASTDSVVLDNSLVSGSYSVNLPSTATTILRIRITPTPPGIITLTLPNTNTNAPGLTLGDGIGDAYDFRLDSNAVFINKSGATSGTIITFANTADSIWLGNGSTWTHNTTVSTTSIIGKLSRKSGTEFGLFIYDAPTSTALSIPVSGQVFGSLKLSGAMAGYGGTGMYDTKKYIRTGGTAMTVRGHFTIDATARDSTTMTNTLNIGGNFTNNGYVKNLPTSTQTFNFNGKGIQYINGSDTTNFVSGIAIASGATVILNTNLAINMLQGASTPKNQNLTVSGTLKCGTHTVNGVGNFNLSSGGTLGIGSPNGISASGATGNILVTGTRTYSTAVNYSYEGSSLQVTGDGLPATVTILTINNSSGVTLSNPVGVSGTLILTSGLLTIGNNSLTLGPTASISGSTSNANMIVPTGTGYVKKILSSSAPHSFTFPVGDNTGTPEYSPVTYTLNSGTLTADTISLKLSNANHPSNSITSDYLNRYWTLSGSGVTNPNYTAVFTYLPADVVGTEASLIGGMWNGASWTNLSAVNTSGHTFTASSRTVFGDYSAYAGTGYITIKAILQGRYRSGDFLSIRDTISAYLANSSSPYSIVDSTKIQLDSLTFTGTGGFNNAATGNYFLVVKHKSSVETWSASPIAFSKGATVNYDFTDNQAKVYGSNLIQVSTSPVRWAIYSGDVNGDGFVDPLDLAIVDQASFDYLSGYGISADINGDGFVDPQDLSLVDQNSFNYVGIKRP